MPSQRRKIGVRQVTAGPVGPTETLPFTVELWDLTRFEIERVLGRASSATLAQAIFAAAKSEHLGRRVTLRQGHVVLADSG